LPKAKQVLEKKLAGTNEPRTIGKEKTLRIETEEVKEVMQEFDDNRR
jgi:hypothetical protein